PFGVEATATLTATGAQAITITNQYTRIDGVTVEATGNRTIDLTIGSELRSGARLVVENKTNGTETLTHGTNITAPVQTGVAGKIHVQTFVFDGTDFLAEGADQQID
ncbi:hypothetical protein IID10_21975, partial [candidate division KSB1 bacterium]|nr:hypothetical protein [candidate division KSB1 bacterium]